MTFFSYLNISEFSTNVAFIDRAFDFNNCVTNCPQIGGLNTYICYITICEDQEFRSGIASSSAQSLSKLKSMCQMDCILI